MKAFVRVIYSSEGKPPAEVKQIMKGLGFHKVKGQPVFEGEVADDADLDDKMEKLHQALRGMEVRYIPSLEAPADASGNVVCNVNEALATWKAIGINVDELGQLLETDLHKFKQRAMILFKDRVDAIADAKEKAMREAEEAKIREMAAKAELEKEAIKRERIAGLLKQEGGVTFHQLHVSSGMDTDELTESLHEMIDSGKVKAEQKGRRVVYTLA